jgi:hypothetical protein
VGNGLRRRGRIPLPSSYVRKSRISQIPTQCTVKGTSTRTAPALVVWRTGNVWRLVRLLGAEMIGKFLAIEACRVAFLDLR